MLKAQKDTETTKNNNLTVEAIQLTALSIRPLSKIRLSTNILIPLNCYAGMFRAVAGGDAQEATTTSDVLIDYLGTVDWE